ncbi:MAG: peptide chain release factor N(5)-glutamine methyltransferase [Xanthomonadales bacterium]|nr:peptide chain release factor N(5)-glutamine methyltransferase [Xanthomonadales bacterium]
MAQSIKNLLTFAREKLADSTSARFDAEILMAHVLESKRSFLYAHPEMELPDSRSDSFKKLIKQRVQGQPVAYLTETSEFWSLPLKVNPAVLIPRPDTERLVEVALTKIPENADWRIADLGTGCGAIALAIASERPKCEIHATDISPAAIDVARENARRLGFGHTHFHYGSWNEPLRGKFHLVVSNPPYIDANDPHLASGDLRFEPRNALCPGADGLSAIREISLLAKAILVDGGWLMFEHGWKQGPATRHAMQEAAYTRLETLQDLQGHDRVTIGEKAVDA